MTSAETWEDTDGGAAAEAGAHANYDGDTEMLAGMELAAAGAALALDRKGKALELGVEAEDDEATWPAMRGAGAHRGGARVRLVGSQGKKACPGCFLDVRSSASVAAASTQAGVGAAWLSRRWGATGDR